MCILRDKTKDVVIVQVPLKSVVSNNETTPYLCKYLLREHLGYDLVG